MTACIGWCESAAECAQWGGCRLEAEYHEQQQQQMYEQQYAEMMAEHQRQHYIDTDGNCVSHETHEPTCEDCLAWCSAIGLR